MHTLNFLYDHRALPYWWYSLTNRWCRGVRNTMQLLHVIVYCHSFKTLLYSIIFARTLFTTDGIFTISKGQLDKDSWNKTWPILYSSKFFVSVKSNVFEVKCRNKLIILMFTLCRIMKSIDDIMNIEKVDILIRY